MLESLLRLQTSAEDPVGATAAIRAVLGSARVSARGDALAWEQLSLVDDGITISRIRSSGDAVRLTIPGASELVVVQVDDGEAVLTTGDEQVRLRDGGLGLVPIGAEAEVRWTSAQLQLHLIPAAPLARLLGVPRTAVQLVAPRLEPCSPELGEYFRRTVRLLTSDVFGTPGVYDRDLVRAASIDLVTAVVVEAFVLTNRSEDASNRDSGVIRRAIAEMRSHLTEPLTVPEIAAAAGVSVRGLQMAFVRQLQVPPLLHLRQLRLEAARTALVEEATVGTTIAEIARRYGYANSGRFSTHYRDEYGEPPSATLRRIREPAGAAPTDGAPSEAELIHADERHGASGIPGPGSDAGDAVAAPAQPDR